MAKNKLVFNTISGKKVLKNTPLNKTFHNWKGDQEKWLIIVPHDDDAVIGMGLTIQAALQAKIDIHVLITTDGSMGYCYAKHQKNIQSIRRKETLDSFKMLGVNPKNVEWLHFKDCSLNNQTGRYQITKKTKSSIKGYDGLQNAYTASLRKIKPTRLFVATSTDLHPDHQLVNSELMISLFHASGDIWPELGAPVAVPEVVEFAVYCDFPTPPDIQLIAGQAELEQKLKAIYAYVSQKQIASLVENVRNNGSEEYFRQIIFKFYEPKSYRKLFK